jgi:predicted negative regulator of RcsB-dependent stress response
MSGSYDFEEQERLAELKAWWEDNRWYVIGGIVAALLAFGGYRGWQYWKTTQAEDAAAMYAPVAQAMKADPKSVQAPATALIEKHPGSFYASESALVLAKLAFDANNLPEARKWLQWVLDKGVEAHKGVARMRLAAVLLDEKKHDEALRVLDGNQEAAFAPLAADLRGDVMLSQGRVDEARASYKAAVDKADPRNPVKNIAQTKLDALGGAQ